jgi:hypothetical protein
MGQLKPLGIESCIMQIASDQYLRGIKLDATLQYPKELHFTDRAIG